MTDDDELRRSFRSFDIERQLNTGIDEKFASIGDVWKSLSDNERSQLREWVNTIANLGNGPNIPPFRATLRLVVTSDEGEFVTFNPETFKEAIEAWDRGETFSPGPFKK